MKNTRSKIITCMQSAVSGGAKKIYIDITPLCNLRCVYCFHYSPFQKAAADDKPKSLSLSDIRAIAEQAIRWKTERLVLAGQGEPTSHPQIRKILTYLHKRRLSINLSTNATFESNLLPIIARINDIGVTLSAPDEESYRVIHSPSVFLFSRVIANIKKLNILRHENGAPPLNLTYIVNALNYTKIPKMFALARQLGIGTIFYRLMQPVKTNRELLLSAQQKIELLHIILALSQSKPDVHHNLNEIRKRLAPTQKKKRLPAYCLTGWYNLFVDAGANVGICCHNRNLKIGNLRENSLDEIWHGEKAQELRFRCLDGFDPKKWPFKGECEWCNTQSASFLQTTSDPCLKI